MAIRVPHGDRGHPPARPQQAAAAAAKPEMVVKGLVDIRVFCPGPFAPAAAAAAAIAGTERSEEQI